MALFGQLRHKLDQAAPILAAKLVRSCKLRHSLKQTCYTLTNLHRALAENLLPNPADGVPPPEQGAVQALVIEELRRIHEGVLACYGLRPSEYLAWKSVQGH